MRKKLSFFIIILLFAVLTKGQSPVDTLQKPFSPVKLGLVAGTGALFYAGTLSSLYTVWYQDNYWIGFHLTNDNAGWMQIDKFGHMYTCYLFGKLGLNSANWAGVSRKKAIWYGGAYGFLFMTSVEALDGHYAEWGFSPMDMVANASGSLLLIGQELALKKQVLTMKFSYHHTELAKYRPYVLGETAMERLVADYNGQTFWYSLNLKSVFNRQEFLPGWLNIAAGYGAYGMLSGETNPKNIYYNGAVIPPIERYRQYFLGFDIDLTKIKTNSKFLRSTFFFLNLIKFPLPTIEFNELGETKFHAFYF